MPFYIERDCFLAVFYSVHNTHYTAPSLSAESVPLAATQIYTLDLSQLPERTGNSVEQEALRCPLDVMIRLSPLL